MFPTLKFQFSNHVQLHSELTSGSKKVIQKRVLLDNFYGTKSRSRNGCLHCKKMKKKCTQEKPSCVRCSKSGVQCIYKEPWLQSEETSKVTKKTPKPSTNTIVRKLASPQILLNFDKPRVVQSIAPAMKTSLDVEAIPQLESSKQGDQEGENLPLDETQLVGNMQSRNGHLKDLDLLQMLYEIVTGKLNGEFFWIHPEKRRAVEYLRKVFRDPCHLVKSPSSSSVYSRLDNVGMLFFENYRNVVTADFSLSPSEADNYFKCFFLPLAEQEEAVLYALTAWGGKLLAGRTSDSPNAYLQKAIESCNVKIRRINSALQRPKTERDPFCNQDIIAVLSCYSLLLGGEISTGDVVKWTNYLNLFYDVLSKVGLKQFLFDNMRSCSKEVLWLISNFFYHDVQHFSKRQTLFSMEAYQEVLKYSGYLGENEVPHVIDYGVDPLVGYNTALHIIEGEIVNLYYQFSEKLKDLEKRLSKMGNELDKVYYNMQRQHICEEFRAKSDLIEAKINSLTPAAAKLNFLDQKSCELQLTLFDLLQLSLKLLLNLLLRQQTPRSLEIQKTLRSVLQEIEIILGSKLELALLFPLMAASLSCYKESDKLLMTSFFRRLVNSCGSVFGTSLYERLQFVLQRYWEQNPEGLHAVDCYDIIKELNWELSLL